MSQPDFEKDALEHWSLGRKLQIAACEEERIALRKRMRELEERWPSCELNPDWNQAIARIRRP